MERRDDLVTSPALVHLVIQQKMVPLPVAPVEFQLAILHVGKIVVTAEGLVIQRQALFEFQLHRILESRALQLPEAKGRE